VCPCVDLPDEIGKGRKDIQNVPGKLKYRVLISDEETTAEAPVDVCKRRRRLIPTSRHIQTLLWKRKVPQILNGESRSTEHVTNSKVNPSIVLTLMHL
jgi:hypothetical protein